MVDVYAFGVIANELLAEKLPFANVSLSVVELMTQIVNTHFRPKLAEFNDFATRRRSAHRWIGAWRLEVSRPEPELA